IYSIPFILFQSFPHSELNNPLPESIKKELDENSSFIKSEPRESDLEFVFNEEKVENDVIKTENSAMIVKKFDTQHVKVCFKSLIIIIIIKSFVFLYFTH